MLMDFLSKSEVILNCGIDIAFFFSYIADIWITDIHLTDFLGSLYSANAILLPKFC